MSGALASVENSFLPSERRLHTRQRLRSLAYVVLDEGNGGIILDISEGGFSVQAVTSLVEDSLPGVRFQLSASRESIETGARVAWWGESKKLVGLAFVDLPEPARTQIREWILSEAASSGPSAAPAFSSEKVEEAAPPAPALGVVPAVRKPKAPKSPAGRSAGRSPGWTQYSTLNLSGPTAKAAPATKRTRRNHAAIAALVTFLALGSLVAGWEVGRAGWDRVFQRVANLTWHTRASAPETPQPPDTVARISDIEVVDANNQRWTVPADGVDEPRSAVESIPQQPPPAKPRPVAQSRKPQIAFRTWVLTPPRNAGGAAAASQPDSSVLPAVSDSPNSAGDVDAPKWSDSRTLAPPPPPAVQAAPSTTTVEQGELIHRVDPIYPPLAKEQRVEGTVKLHVAVGADGDVRGVELLGGPALLLEAARSAVRQWRYAPTLVNGKPIESQRDISLVFHLSRPSN